MRLLKDMRLLSKVCLLTRVYGIAQANLYHDDGARALYLTCAWGQECLAASSASNIHGNLQRITEGDLNTSEKSDLH